jgi:hypothetical protein
MIFNYILCTVHKVFGDRKISRKLWLPSSPHMNLCDFYLRGMWKDKVYSNNPHTEDDRKKKHCDWLWMCLLHVTNICKPKETTSSPPLNKVSKNQILRATLELNGLNANWWQIKWQPVQHCLVSCETVCVVMNSMGQINQGPCIGNSL